MALKMKVETLEGMDEATQSLYVEKEGKFVLDLEDNVVPRDKLNEFRDSNITLKKELDEIKQAVSGNKSQFDKIMTVMTQFTKEESDKELEEAIISGPEAVNALIEKRAETRSERMKEDYEVKFSEQKSLNDKYYSQLEASMVDSEISRLAVKHNVKSDLLDDVLTRGKTKFKLNDEGSVVAMVDGEIMYNKDNEPYSIEEFIQELPPVFFEQASGTGASNKLKGGSNGSYSFTYRGKEHKV